MDIRQKKEAQEGLYIYIFIYDSTLRYVYTRQALVALLSEECASSSGASPDEPKAKQRKVTKDCVGNGFMNRGRSPISLARPPSKCTMKLNSSKISSTRWVSHEANPLPTHPRTGQGNRAHEIRSRIEMLFHPFSFKPFHTHFNRLSTPNPGMKARSCPRGIGRL